MAVEDGPGDPEGSLSGCFPEPFEETVDLQLVHKLVEPAWIDPGQKPTTGRGNLE